MLTNDSFQSHLDIDNFENYTREKANVIRQHQLNPEVAYDDKQIIQDNLSPFDPLT